MTIRRMVCWRWTRAGAACCTRALRYSGTRYSQQCSRLSFSASQPSPSISISAMPNSLIAPGISRWWNLSLLCQHDASASLFCKRCVILCRLLYIYSKIIDFWSAIHISWLETKCFRCLCLPVSYFSVSDLLREKL